MVNQINNFPKKINITNLPSNQAPKAIDEKENKRPIDKISRKEKCFKCNNSLFIMFVRGSNGFSRKNN
jgi:hypothetical protein